MGAPHLLGNPNVLLTNNWWRITGNINSGFDVDLTLPASFVPDTGDEVCRYTGPGTTWNCAASSLTGTTITRNNVTQFSDWATSEDGNPTVNALISFAAHSNLPWMGAGLVLSVLAAGLLITLRQVKIRKQATDKHLTKPH